MATFWYIELLGTLCARQGTQEIKRFRTRRTGCLLACLAYFPQKSHARENLIELFWPDAALDDARNNLSVSLNSLRKQFEPPGTPGGSVLWADRTHVRLNADAIRTDVADFEDAIRFASHQSGSEEIAGLTRAVECYRGELLPGYYDEWVLTERVRLEDVYLHALRRLTQRLAQANHCEQALEYAHRAVRLDPLREQTRRDLIRLYVALGRPLAALEQYHELVRLLDQKLGGVPSAATRELIAPLLQSSAPNALRDTHTFINAPAVSPPLSTVEDRPIEKLPSRGNLPVQFTRFFGRIGECERIQTILSSSESCLLTLTGPGGIGKTLLALEAARRCKDTFCDGVWFVPLADLADAGRLYDRILDVISPVRQPGVTAIEQITSVFAASRVLLLLDNLEQLGEVGARAVQMLRERNPNLSLLATTRVPLELAGEQEIAISPLPAPDRAGLPERLLEFPSVQLFIDRAQARQPDFQITRRNAAGIAALCDRLEGIPLAIELAAGWAKLLTPPQMLTQLQNRFEFLVSRRADLPERHRTLRAALESSYRLLRPEQQQLFARLSLFRGGWTLDAAERVCEEPQALLLLASLQQASLIVANETDETDGVMRYQMLETLREFGAEHLVPEERLWLERRHAEYYSDFVQLISARRDGPNEAIWLNHLNAERENILAALNWFAQHPEGIAQGLPLAVNLNPYWSLRNLLAEGQKYLEILVQQAAEKANEKAPAELYKAYSCLGTMHYLQNDFPKAQHYYECGLPLVQKSGDTLWEAHFFKLLGNVAWSQGHYAEARSLYETGLDLFRRIGRPLHAAHLVDSLGNIASAMGDFVSAKRYHEEPLPIMRQGGPSSLARALVNLGGVCRELGEYETAVTYLEEGLQIARELDMPQTLLHLFINLGSVAIYRHDFKTATPLLQEGLALCLDQSNELLFAFLAEAIGNIAFINRDFASGCRLWAYAETVRTRLGSPRSDPDQAYYTQRIEEARLFESEKNIAADIAEGKRQTQSQVYNLAQQVLQNTEKSTLMTTL